MEFERLEYLVVGAGLWGSVIAERIATVLEKPVRVIDRRSHVGGNCHSYRDPRTGIECHAYGTHIFHTAIPEVWDYIGNFTDFTTYRHKVLTEYKGHVYPMPISLATINNFYDINLKPWEVEAFIAKESGRTGNVSENPPSNLEEKAISLIGRPLYEAFIKGYTQKQWEKDPKELPPEIITRLPVRTNYNIDYFNDPWQGMPVKGYAAIFNRLLDDEKIEVSLGVDFKSIASKISKTCRIFYSGTLDELCDYKFGPLEWRSLRFEQSVEPHPDVQGTSVLNNADLETPWTRTHEFKHLHPERGPQGESSVVSKEFPDSFEIGKIPYYPIETQENKNLHKKYKDMVAETYPSMIVGGRLGDYKYFDMDRTIENALHAFEKFAKDLTR
ncbi:MAG: NAD(P)-binding protein [Desulfovibrio sp.]|jgi:UDP-galactopyranose mutase|nr:NAD(P)-binding protein [Desulfovibrio sp.]